MESPVACKTLKILQRSILVRRFIPALGELLKQFHKLLKQDVLFHQGEEQQKAFQRVNDVLTSTLAIISLVECLSLTLYLTSTNKSIGALLAQEVEEIKHPFII